jgi:TorA maturation chaperone TorD
VKTTKRRNYVTDTSTPTKTDWTETLTGEILLFGLLGRALYTYPDQKERSWLQSLIEEQVFSEAPFAAEQADVVEGLRLLQVWSDGGLNERAFEDLQGDYTRLFIGPGKVIVPPWESVYFNEERLTFQEQTLDVRDWYRRFGLEAEHLHHEPDDHIGLEMAFLVHLAQLGVAELEEGNQANLEQMLRAQSDFLSKHLLQWGPNFCDQLCDKAHTSFYSGLALLARGALSELAQLFQIDLSLKVN